MSAFEEAFNHLKNSKIDEFELVFSNQKITTIRITDSEISEIKQNFDENYGVRLIREKKIAGVQFRYKKNLKNMIDDALKTTRHLKPRVFWKSLPSKNPKIRKIDGLFDKKLSEITGSDASDLAQEMINSAENAKIQKISGSLNIVSESFELVNSHGLALKDNGTYISGIINTDSDLGLENVSGIGHDCCRTLDKFKPDKIGNEAKVMCLESLNPQTCIEDEYTVIFEPYCIAEILTFVMSPNFNFKTYSEQKSCFSNNFNEKIAVDSLTLVDEPHISQGIGSKIFDDEGSETLPNFLIKKGEFCGTFSNLFDSFKKEEKTTGNASRPGSPMGRSSQPIPITLPHNLQIKKGNSSKQDMIKDTKKGLLIGRLWYTYAVNPIKGDFSCTARSGIRIIDNGEVKNYGKPVRIIHNIHHMLKNIIEIGNDSRNVIPWASIPSITPSLKVDGIRIKPI